MMVKSKLRNLIFSQAFYNSGKLTEMIEQGRTYCFISNIDNMGATVDFGILKVKSLWTL